MTVAVNQRVRAGEGKNGEIVILGAWCSSCEREVMPTSGGDCSWCHARIVDEDSLSARDLVNQLQGSNGAAPARDTPAAAVPEIRTSKWTRETVIAAIQEFAAEHGRTPTQKDRGGLVTAAKTVFGTWANAVEAAGLPRPRRGVTTHVRAGVAQPDRAPADQADDAGSKPAPRSEDEPAALAEREAGEDEATEGSPDGAPFPASGSDALTRSANAEGETGGALDLATLTNSDAADWITRCDLEAERCTEDAARLVRRAKGFKTIGDGLRILQETSA